MRIGIFGGSFDPVHTGHLILAEQVREQAELDEVWFVPSAVAPHKLEGPRGTARQRREMLEIATAGHPAFRISTMELDRGGTSYTVDTLRQIRTERPEDGIFLLIGGDSLRDLPTWREPGAICELAMPLVYARPGSHVDFGVLRPFVNAGRLEAIAAHAIHARQIDISSTDLRERIRSGRSIRYLVPRGVEAYIRQAGLYDPADAADGAPGAGK